MSMQAVCEHMLHATVLYNCSAKHCVASGLKPYLPFTLRT